jgi:hypothetical protein
MPSEDEALIEALGLREVTWPGGLSDEPCKVCGASVYVRSYQPPTGGRSDTRPILTRICLNDACTTRVNRTAPASVRDET